MSKPEETLLLLCKQHKLTLGLAESCTGGAFASRLTKIPGASKSFAGSIVSYQDQTKIDLLKVPEKMLKDEGAVSRIVAEKMLEGALSQFSANIAAAITGIAGPNGGTPLLPIGTVFIAVGGKPFPTKILSLQLSGSRVAIIEKAVDEGIVQLIQLIEGIFPS